LIRNAFHTSWAFWKKTGEKQHTIHNCFLIVKILTTVTSLQALGEGSGYQSPRHQGAFAYSGVTMVMRWTPARFCYGWLDFILTASERWPWASQGSLRLNVFVWIPEAEEYVPQRLSVGQLWWYLSTTLDNTDARVNQATTLQILNKQDLLSFAMISVTPPLSGAASDKCGLWAQSLMSEFLVISLTSCTPATSFPLLWKAYTWWYSPQSWWTKWAYARTHIDI
jgi:hypothetical protein